jgi:hypothetical protein
VHLLAPHAQEEELARLSSLLAQAQAQTDAARGREEEARASAREHAERARRSEALAAELEADVGQVGLLYHAEYGSAVVHSLSAYCVDRPCTGTASGS